MTQLGLLYEKEKIEYGNQKIRETSIKERTRMADKLRTGVKPVPFFTHSITPTASASHMWYPPPQTFRFRCLPSFYL